MTNPATSIRNAVVNTYRVAQALSGKKTWVTENRQLDGKEFTYILGQRPEGPFLPNLIPKPAPKPDYSNSLLVKGQKKGPGFMQLPCDIIFEQNVVLPMRDGVKLYADIFRPVDEQATYPIIIAWGPYGKHLNNDGWFSSKPAYVGLKKDDFSGYENFEGPDPAFWVHRGYAVVNVDIRGSWYSEGNLHFWGKQDEADGFDTVEFLAALPWCNGKVGMAGNSWLAISQWFIAAGNPPHLAAIAPWEGLSDAYRDQHRRGGIDSSNIPGMISVIIPTTGMLEDAGVMAEKSPIWNEYWDDKKVELHKINVPAYVVASYTSKIHVSGSFRAWKNISSKQKWLRVHPHQEWYDFHQRQPDLLKFFDHFLKCIDNDWKETPPVRLSLLRHTDKPILDQPYTTYPPPEAVMTKYYLNAMNSTAVLGIPSEPCSISYKAEKDDEVHFDILFHNTTTIAGYANLLLHLQCWEHDDMDVFVMLRKLSKAGEPVDNLNYPVSVPASTLAKTNIAFLKGSSGMIRASHRAVTQSDETLPGELFHPHNAEDKIKPGKIVSVNFSTWPIGTVYEAGEALRLSISGHDMSYPEDPMIPKNPNWNKGKHVLYTGGEYDSYISLPILEFS